MMCNLPSFLPAATLAAAVTGPPVAPGPASQPKLQTVSFSLLLSDISATGHSADVQVRSGFVLGVLKPMWLLTNDPSNLGRRINCLRVSYFEATDWLLEI